MRSDNKFSFNPSTSGAPNNLLLNLGLADDIKQEPKDVPAGAGDASAKTSHDNRILKGLLNQEDEEEAMNAANSNAADRFQQGRSAECGKSENNMLHQLLNVRSDDDHEERLGLRKPNELLKKLLKDSDEDQSNVDHGYQEREEQLLKSLGFPSQSQAQQNAPVTSAPSTPIGKSPSGIFNQIHYLFIVIHSHPILSHAIPFRPILFYVLYLASIINLYHYWYCALFWVL